MKYKFSVNFGKFLEVVSDFIAEQWKSVLFSAALAGILEHFGYLKIFAKFSWFIVASLAAQQPSDGIFLEDAIAVVVTVNENRFLSHYGEKRPLDRCALRDDIQSILNKKPYRLAIDFDMSPLLNPNDSERNCQKNLDQLLDKYHEIIAILTPFSAKGDLKEIKHRWMLERCAAGGHFADGSLNRSFGMINEHVIGTEPMLRSRFAEQLKFGLNDLICEKIVSAKTIDENKWLEENGESLLQESRETEPINFLAAQKKIALLEIGTNNFENVKNIKEHIVLFGGNWGLDDQYITSLGELPGVAVHGARLVSLDLPANTPGPFFGFLIDVCIALSFSLVVKRFWNSYIKATRFDHEIEQVTHGHLYSAIGTFVICSFIVTYLLLVFYFILASKHLYLRYGVMLTPLVMAIAILFDGFVSAPIEQIRHLLKSREKDKIHVKMDPQILKYESTSIFKMQIIDLYKRGFVTILVVTLLIFLICLGISGDQNSHYIISDIIFIGPVLLMFFSVMACFLHYIFKIIVNCDGILMKMISSMCNIFSMRSIDKFTSNEFKAELYKNHSVIIVRFGIFLGWLRSILFWLVLAYYGYVQMHGFFGNSH